MTPPDTLPALLEAASGADQRECLLAAFNAVYGDKPPRVHGGSPELDAWLAAFNPFHRMLEAKAYESAAMTLVPEGWLLDQLQEHWLDGHYSARILKRPSISQRETFENGGAICLADAAGKAATPALALCSASLRAREAGEGR